MCVSGGVWGGVCVWCLCGVCVSGGCGVGVGGLSGFGGQGSFVVREAFVYLAAEADNRRLEKIKHVCAATPPKDDVSMETCSSIHKEITRNPERKSSGSVDLPAAA